MKHNIYNHILLALSLPMMVIVFQNCSKSQFNASNMSSDSGADSFASTDLNSANSYLQNQSIFSLVDKNSDNVQFGKVSGVTVDSTSNNVYFQADNHLYRMQPDKSVSMISLNQEAGLTYSGIEVNPLTQDLYTVEYENGKFNGVIKISPNGQITDVINKDAFNNGQFIVSQTANSSTRLNIGSISQMYLIRVDNLPLLKIISASNTYYWIDLVNRRVIDVFEMTCMRTKDCGDSKNLMNLVMAAQIDPRNDLDSAGNSYLSSTCRIWLTHPNSLNSEYLGKACGAN